MYSVILCGGSGTRLWPLSRKNFPKQFLALYSDKSLLQETFLRMKELMETDRIYFLTNKENYFNVSNQVKDIQPNFNEAQILTEPMSLNTAPAMTYAMKYLEDKVKAKDGEPVLFLPSDHYIGDNEKYLAVVKYALELVNGYIGTIGIMPKSPETGYGYIRKGESLGGFSRVSEFKEKPDPAAAEQYLATGHYLWNSGMYFFNLQTFKRELAEHAPEYNRIFQLDFDSFLEIFHRLPELPFDVVISEKSKNVAVFDGEFKWSDIGSFESLAEIMDSQSNCQHVSIDSKNVFIHSTNNRLIATLGIEDVIIIENNDSILVQKKGYSEQVKKVVNYLKDHQIKELEHNLLVHRPWGKYEVLIDQPNHKVKKITVYPGAKLSLQAHHHRSEHWIVIKGIARIVNGDNSIYLRESESTYIPAFTVHRMENPGKINLEIIEVQTGNYLEEDDIIRYNDDYNRV